MKQACVKGLYSCLRNRIRKERFTEVHDRYKKIIKVSGYYSAVAFNARVAFLKTSRNSN